MARPLVFDHRGTTFGCGMVKVDRSRLYGSKETEVLDSEGRRCELATLASDGRTILGRGGRGLGWVDQDGLWCDRKDLTPVDLEGRPMSPVPSSFAAPIPLVEVTNASAYLDHDIRLLYVLEVPDEAAALRQELAGGAIYRFSYSWRGGVDPDVGFLLANHDGDVFLAVGKPGLFTFIGLAEAAAPTDDAADEAEAEDLMDFDMV